MGKNDIRNDVESIYDEADELCGNACEIIKKCLSELDENKRTTQELLKIEEKYRSIEKIIAD